MGMKINATKSSGGTVRVKGPMGMKVSMNTSSGGKSVGDMKMNLGSGFGNAGFGNLGFSNSGFSNS